MKMLHKEFEAVLNDVANSLGLSISLEKLKNDSQYDFSLRVTALDKPSGLRLKISEGLLSWEIILELDHFAGDLLRLFQSTFLSRKTDVMSVRNASYKYPVKFDFKVNGQNIEEFDNPGAWNELIFKLQVRYPTEENKFKAFKELLLIAFCSILPLFTEDSTRENEDMVLVIDENWEEEGALSRIMSNKYERSKLNRSLCLAYFGFECQGCGILMEAKYGPLGKEVIHVHHLVPVSKMNEIKILNPTKDLIPLCPNCHVIVHRSEPPISIEGLKTILTN